MFLTIFSTLVPVFGIIFLGLIIARRGITPMSTATGLNQFVYWVSLPAMMFGILTRLDVTVVSGCFLPGLYGSLIISYVFVYLVLRVVLKTGKEAAMMFSCLANFSNIAFMGVAMVSFLLPGDDHAVLIAGTCALLYVFIMPYTDTALEMSQHEGEKFQQQLKTLGRTFLRNPMVVAASFGLILNLSGIGMPASINSLVSMLGATAAPCALFAMGMVMNAQLIGFGSFRSELLAQQTVVHVAKLVLMPLVTFITLYLLGMRGTTLGVITLSAGMPVGVAVYVVAEKYQVCTRESSMIIFMNTLASIITLPAIIVILHKLGFLG